MIVDKDYLRKILIQRVLAKYHDHSSFDKYMLNMKINSTEGYIEELIEIIASQVKIARIEVNESGIPVFALNAISMLHEKLKLDDDSPFEYLLSEQELIEAREIMEFITNKCIQEFLTMYMVYKGEISFVDLDREAAIMGREISKGGEKLLNSSVQEFIFSNLDHHVKFSTIKLQKIAQRLYDDGLIDNEKYFVTCVTNFSESKVTFTWKNASERELLFILYNLYGEKEVVNNMKIGEIARKIAGLNITTQRVNQNFSKFIKSLNHSSTNKERYYREYKWFFDILLEKAP